MSEATPQPGQGTATAAPSTAAALSASHATTAVSASTQVTASATTPPNPQIAWLGDGVDEATLGYVANKGWDDPKKAVQSYQNLEKLLGADKAGNAIVLPKPEADAKEWDAIWNRLGRPAEPAGYNVLVPEGGSKEFQDEMLKEAHAAGMPKAMAEKLFNKFNEKQVEARKAQQIAKEQQFVADDQAVKQEWGQAYVQNLAQAQAAARVLGLDGPTIDKLSDALGHKATMTLLQKIGSKTGEAEFVSGDGSTNFGGVMTPAQAKAEIVALRNDKNFAARYLNNDKAAIAEMERLHKFAYPS